MQGNHWSLLAINVENKSAYDGDSLRWPVPQNLISALEENFRVLECKLGIDIHSCVQDIITIHQPCGGTHTCPEQGTSFYPLQTCSNVCGIIVMSMVAVMANSWEEWCKWTSLTAPEVLQNPSLHSTYLRINTLSWIVENKIDAATLNKFPSSSIKKVDSMPATLKCTPVQVNTGDILCRNNLPVIENSKPKTNAITGETWNDDDFIPPKKATKQDFSVSEDKIFTQSKTAKVVITEMFPDTYEYKFIDIFEHNTGSYHCNFRLKLQPEKDARKWVADYNDKTGDYGL